MFGRHVHQWKDLPDVDYHPPKLSTDVKISGPHALEIMQLFHRQETGFTIVHQRCSICGHLASREIAGRFIPSHPQLNLVESPEELEYK